MEHTLCPPGVPCRIGWWNIPIPLRVVFFAVMAVAVGIMLYGIVQRIKLWRAGQPALSFDRPWERTLRTLKYAVAQARILRQSYPAVMHLAIFWTMVLFFIGTVLGSLDTDVFELIFKTKLLIGDFYLIEKVVLDLAALFALVGLGLAIYRRYIVKPDRLNIDWRFNLTLPLLVFIVLTGLFVEALRLSAQQPAWAPFSVVAYPISLLFRGSDVAGLEIAHRVLWSIHFLSVAAAFATLPRTNLFHVFTSPANIFFAPFKVKGALQPIRNLEQAEQLGAGKLTDFPQPQLVNFDACTECGRCQVVCPAYAANQPLNPKYVVLDLQGALTAFGETRRRGGAGNGNGASSRPSIPASQMVGDVIKHETLWACTTCYGCVYECPVLIEHVDAIVDMRRYLALMEGDIPASLATTLTNIERAGNPWKQPKRKRAAWARR